MQEMGIIRFWHVNAGNVVWQVAEPSLLEEFSHEVWLKRAIHNVGKYYQFIKERRESLEELEKMKTATSAVTLSATHPVAPDVAMMAQVAGLVDDIGSLRVKLKEQDTHIAELEEKLACKPQVSNGDVAAYLAEFRSKIKI